LAELESALEVRIQFFTRSPNISEFVTSEATASFSGNNREKTATYKSLIFQPFLTFLCEIQFEKPAQNKTSFEPP